MSNIIINRRNTKIRKRRKPKNAGKAIYDSGGFLIGYKKKSAKTKSISQKDLQVFRKFLRSKRGTKLVKR